MATAAVAFGAGLSGCSAFQNSDNNGPNSSASTNQNRQQSTMQNSQNDNTREKEAIKQLYRDGFQAVSRGLELDRESLNELDNGNLPESIAKSAEAERHHRTGRHRFSVAYMLSLLVTPERVQQVLREAERHAKLSAEFANANKNVRMIQILVDNGDTDVSIPLLTYGADALEARNNINRKAVEYVENLIEG